MAVCLLDLPIELLSLLLEYLGPTDRISLGRTCSLLYEMQMEVGLRRNTTVTLRDDAIKAMEVLSASQRRFHHLIFHGTELNKDRVSSWDNFWGHVGQHLVSLTLQDCNISERTFSETLFQCKTLESLTLDNCNSLFMVGKLLESQEDLRKAQDTMHMLKELRLDNNRYLSDALFNRLVTVAANIEKLSLAGCQISFHPAIYKRFYPSRSQVASESVLTFQNIMHFISHQGQRLVSLDFSSTLLDNLALEEIARTPELKLRELRIAKCQQVTDVGIASISNNHPFLSLLDVTTCTKLTDEAVLGVCQNLAHLQVLLLEGCNKITDVGISNLGHLTHMEELNLAECELLTSDGIQHIVTSSKFTRLVSLNLAACRLDEANVIEIALRFPTLRYLDLSHCRAGVTDKSMKAICQYLHGLLSLSISWCYKVGNQGLTSAQVLPSTSSSSSSLVTLGNEEAGNIPDEMLPFNSSSGSFESIDEGGSTTERDLDESSTSLSDLRGLKKLNLCACEEITDIALRAAIRFRELVFLDLSLCNKITDKGLVSLGACNGSLETIILNQCRQITDIGVTAMVKCLPRLKHIDLQGCRKIGNDTLDALGRCCPDLRYLDVSICLNVTSEGLEKLESKLNCLHTVHKRHLQSGSIAGLPPITWKQVKTKHSARRILRSLCSVCSSQQKEVK